MRFRIGYSYRDPYDATFDGQSEWTSPDVADEDAARSLFHEDHSSSTHMIDYVIPIQET